MVEQSKTHKSNVLKERDIHKNLHDQKNKSFLRFILCGSDLSFLMTAAKNRSDNLLNFYKNKGK